MTVNILIRRYDVFDEFGINALMATIPVRDVPEETNRPDDLFLLADKVLARWGADAGYNPNRLEEFFYAVPMIQAPGFTYDEVMGW